MNKKDMGLQGFSKSTQTVIPYYFFIPKAIISFSFINSNMQSITSKYSSDIIERARKIKVIAFDVDGVMTDGGIIYDNTGIEYKKFNVKDGQIIVLLKRFNIKCGAITGRKSEVVRHRCVELKLDFHFHGVIKKVEKYEEIKETFGVKDEEIAYIGDDIIDLPVLSRAGLAIVPSDGLVYVKDYAHIVTEAAGGKGVIREAADLILAAQGKMEEILEMMNNL
jgi:3-deoxy-D-manno-octulosonate 8-phosphate phosphatase (KDO 8-P phosphatase)